MRRNLKREFSVMSPLRYAVIVIGALALNVALWSGVHSQIANPGVQQAPGAVAANDCVKWVGTNKITTTGAPCTPGFTPSALTKTDDTNVTLTLTGVPNTALLQSVNAALGWNGTLAAGRLNSAVLQSCAASDVSCIIAAQVGTFTLGAFTGDIGKSSGSLATTTLKFSGNVLPVTAGADSQILLGSGASNFIFSTIPNCPAGVIQYTAATHLFNCSAAGTGSVTTFSAGTLSPLFTTSVATPTSTPALTFALSTANANLFFAGPTSGGAAAPSYRALQACGDMPSGTLVHHSISLQTTANTDNAANSPGAGTIMAATAGSLMSAAASITPCASTNLCVARIHSGTFGTSTTGNQVVTFGLFQDAGANAISQQQINAINLNGGTANVPTIMPDVIYSGNCGTTSTTTFKGRFGGQNAGTTTFNGTSGVAFADGVHRVGIEVWEYVP